MTEPAPPNVTKMIQKDAADPKNGMTLDELAAFVAEALRQDIPGDTVVRMTANWRSSFKHVKING